jgi:uncharacterized protein YjbI with pentapeptide repeats
VQEFLGDVVNFSLRGGKFVAAHFGACFDRLNLSEALFLGTDFSGLPDSGSSRNLGARLGEFWLKLRPYVS